MVLAIFNYIFHTFQVSFANKELEINKGMPLFIIKLNKLKLKNISIVGTAETDITAVFKLKSMRRFKTFRTGINVTNVEYRQRNKKFTKE